ncbi:hypothetical protein BDV37DRAFT_290023 [Aspergillus pseudonomiae]|uniref:Uncharacterized protein n=1 Tax=Aspergillus pseudonomiae TaxID=1506151 RepID=A0A5N7CT11_9EURO|nr:uncharacterized protein BDV37DRAFT_290023 [Aspergillus pseudonomiae]KAE8396758.1 hypothetical protein BDV37DRAFT_290023 [Aspergillus pseudonomiae]
MGQIWTTPTDAVGGVDLSLQAALQRVVVTQIGLQLSKIVYDAPLRKRGFEREYIRDETAKKLIQCIDVYLRLELMRSRTLCC